MVVLVVALASVAMSIVPAPQAPWAKEVTVPTRVVEEVEGTTVVVQVVLLEEGVGPV